MLTKNPAHSRLDLNAAQSIKMAFTAPISTTGGRVVQQHPSARPSFT